MPNLSILEVSWLLVCLDLIFPDILMEKAKNKQIFKSTPNICHEK